MSANPTNSQTSQPPKLLDQLRGKIRLLRSSKRTEDASVDWATKFIVFHGRRSGRGLREHLRCPNQELTGKKTDCRSFAGNIRDINNSAFITDAELRPFGSCNPGRS